jgi:polyphenol oxidase
VLMADAAAGVVGAAHAGWRGALDGVIEAAVGAMCRLGAENRRIAAAVGPCIQQRSYEVGPEFHARFVAADPSNAEFFVAATRANHHLFDLPAFVARRLGALGLGAVEIAADDTCADEARFFSYRRATLTRERDYGRGLSAIAIDG